MLKIQKLKPDIKSFLQKWKENTERVLSGSFGSIKVGWRVDLSLDSICTSNEDACANKGCTDYIGCNQSNVADCTNDGCTTNVLNCAFYFVY